MIFIMNKYYQFYTTYFIGFTKIMLVKQEISSLVIWTPISQVNATHTIPCYTRISPNSLAEQRISSFMVRSIRIYPKRPINLLY